MVLTSRPTSATSARPEQVPGDRRRTGCGASTACSAAWRRASPSRQATAAAAAVDQLVAWRACARFSGSGRRATRSGLRWTMSAASRLVPTRRAQAPGRLRRVAERARQLVGPVAVAGQVAQAEQAEVGVGRLGQPAEHAAAASAASAATTGSSPRVSSPPRRRVAVAVGEAEGGEPRVDGAGAGQERRRRRRRTPRAAGGSRGARGSSRTVAWWRDQRPARAAPRRRRRRRSR